MMLSIIFSKLADGTKKKDFAMVVKSSQYKKLVLIFLLIRPCSVGAYDSHDL